MALNFGGVMLIGCQSSSQKEDAAREEVKDATHDLADAQKELRSDSIQAVNAEEWKIFKNEAEAKSRSNDLRIKSIKKKMKNAGSPLDGVDQERIEALEKRNSDLEKRVKGFEEKNSDWASFKREFNHDVDQFGESLKDFGKNNRK